MRQISMVSFEHLGRSVAKTLGKQPEPVSCCHINSDIFIYRDCLQPESTGAHQWLDDITKWPVGICLHVFLNLIIIMSKRHGLAVSRY